MTFERLKVSGLQVGPSPNVKPVNLKLFAMVLLVALVVRVCLWFAYRPVSYSDTNSYHRTALAIQDGWNVDGTRTPGYPIFLLLFRPEADGWQQRAWLGQMALGVVLTGLMFALGWLTTGKNWAAVLMGLAYTLNLQQVFFESNLITEALTTFFLTLTLVGLAMWLYRQMPSSPALPPQGEGSEPLSCRERGRGEGKPASFKNNVLSLSLAFAIGLAAALTAIVRPLFIFLPPWIALFFIFQVSNGKLSLKLSNFQHLVPLLLPSVFILGGWIFFIHESYGNWSMTTMGGYHMIQHTGAYFEYVPDEYAAIRDTYIKYRDAQITATGTQTNAIWEAIPEMSKASGIGFYDLSDKLMEISLQLIREHPDLYLKNALQGWWMFWRAPVYWSADALRWPGLAAPLRGLILVERIVLFTANMVFLVLSVGIVVLWIINRLRKVEGCRLKVGRQTFNLQPSTFDIFLASALWVCSVFQTLLDHGDNPRFLVPLQMGVVLWLVMQVGRFTSLQVESLKNQSGD
jgi:hypothetical protein